MYFLDEYYNDDQYHDNLKEYYTEHPHTFSFWDDIPEPEVKKEKKINYKGELPF